MSFVFCWFCILLRSVKAGIVLAMAESKRTVASFETTFRFPLGSFAAASSPPFSVSFPALRSL
jgi:hypothetical protein